MKRLSDETRRTSLHPMRNFDRRLERAPRRELTAEEIRTALATQDQDTLAAFKSLVESDFESGSLTELSASLDVLAASADANRKAGYPMVIEVSEAGAEHTQRVLTELARSRTELHPPYGINMAQVRTELIGRLVKHGIVKLDFPALASPILAAMELVSPLAARELGRFLQSGKSVFDFSSSSTVGELVAKESEKQTSTTKLDGDIGGKKPASKNGSYVWLSRQLSFGSRSPGGSSQSKPPAP